MYGQTNCWVLPEGDYVAVRGPDNCAYVMAHRAALNLSYQDRLPEVSAFLCIPAFSCLRACPSLKRACLSHALFSSTAHGNPHSIPPSPHPSVVNL